MCFIWLNLPGTSRQKLLIDFMHFQRVNQYAVGALFLAVVSHLGHRPGENDAIDALESGGLGLNINSPVARYMSCSAIVFEIRKVTTKGRLARFSGISLWPLILALVVEARGSALRWRHRT